jgi:pimeloyl-ACP methyl ester carboxylesterase
LTSPWWPQPISRSARPRSRARLGQAAPAQRRQQHVQIRPNYYRAAEPYFYLSGAWKGAKITQPSFYIAGKADGLSGLCPPVEKLGVSLPGLVGTLEIDNVGHWVQHEAAAEVNDQIVKFLRTVNPA